MHPSLSLLTLLPLTLAKNIPITVGADAKLAFNPNNVAAVVGDTLTFSYFPKNHSVVQSSFTDPCHPLAGGGVFSGFQPLAAGPGPVSFVVTVNDTKPIWLYCAQTTGSHCQKGMTMVVNQPPPPSPNTLDAYNLAANKTGNSTVPPNIAGGVFIKTNSTSTSGGSTASGTGSGSKATGTGVSYNKSSGYGSSTGPSGSGSSVISFTGSAASVTSGVSVLIAATGAAAFGLF